MNRAESVAQQLLQKTNLARIPVPVEDIAQALGVELLYRPLDSDTSGMLFREPSRTIIGVNSTHPATRQRFTIAHEIAHLQLHKGRPLIVDSFIHVNRRDTKSSLATDAEEIQANAFAAELLMPAALLRQEVTRSLNARAMPSQDQLVQNLASRFQVSPQAMAYRLINLGLLRTTP